MLTFSNIRGGRHSVILAAFHIGGGRGALVPELILYPTSVKAGFQENKHGIGPVRTKLNPRMGFRYQFSVPV